MTTRRWLFGDQLGPHFLDRPDQRVLLVESSRVFGRRRFHRAKAHLILSAMRHRAAELGQRCHYARTPTYREALAELGEPLTVCQPTSYAADRFVRSLPGVEVLPARGYATSREDFEAWVTRQGRKRLLLEDFYREARVRHGVLVEGEQPVGGRWNLDADNRQPPPKGAHRLDVPEPWWPVEDDVDAQVREDLDRWQRDGVADFVGEDGPRRFAVTRAEALEALGHFVEHRLGAFGPYEDAMLSGDDWMSHSMLSATTNLGLLDPLEIVRTVESAYRAGEVPLASAEGFVRQVIGWRDYVWNLYWHQGPRYRKDNYLGHGEPLPQWFLDLDADAVQARCLSHVLGTLRDNGWVHHIPRLMVLGNYGLQRGWDPEQLADWFLRSFVDGYDWVMVPNVVGMSQHADAGVMATKPYASGGAYINRMSDFCGSCTYSPSVRVGEKACPYTAGYWWFLHRQRQRLAGNQRMRQPLRGLDRLRDLEELVEQEAGRGSAPP